MQKKILDGSGEGKGGEDQFGSGSLLHRRSNIIIIISKFAENSENPNTITVSI